jgi:hypothetical protein
MDISQDVRDISPVFPSDNCTGHCSKYTDEVGYFEESVPASH